MATLDEIRNALRSGKTIPTVKLPPKKQKELLNKKNRELARKFTISIGGTDATLNFGKFSGHSVSDMAKTDKGTGYLMYIIKEFADKDLIDVCKYNLRLVGKMSPDDEDDPDDFDDEDAPF